MSDYEPRIVKKSADRHNQDKPRPTLIPPVWTEAMMRVLENGAKKYGVYNWQKGLNYSSVVDSLERHVLAFRNGEDRDKESGEYHMAHVAVNALFLLYYQAKGMIEYDDRETYR